MRKFLGLFVAAALVIPAAAIVAGPAGAAGGTSCASGSGSATFNPPLPDLTSTKKVKDVLKATGTLSGCTGAVSGGTFTGLSPASTGSNCKTIATPTSVGTKLKLTIKWNTGATSTIQAMLKQIPKKPVTNQTVSGPVTAGLFKGSKLSGKFTYTLAKGTCSKGHALAKVTFASDGPIVIK